MIYKRILYTIFLAICAVMLNTTTIFAQGVSVKNATLEIDGKSAPSLSATFEFSDEKDLIKSWKVYLKKQEKIKLGTKSGMLVDKAAGPNNISEKLQDVYSKVTTKDGISELYFTVSLGYSNYIDATTHPVEFQKVRSLFQNFATEYSTKFYTDLLRDKDRSYNDAQRDLEKGQSKFSNNRSKIESNDDDIKKMRDKIEDLIKENRSLTESNIGLNKEIEGFQKKSEERKMELESVKIKMKELGINP